MLGAHLECRLYIVHSMIKALYNRANHFRVKIEIQLDECVSHPETIDETIEVFRGVFYS